MLPCIFHFEEILYFVDIQLHINNIYKKAWSSLTKCSYSDQVFSRNIFKPLCLKSKTLVHAQPTITLIHTTCRYLDMVSDGNLH